MKFLAKEFPTLFLVRDGNGDAHMYSQDPLLFKNCLEDFEITDLDDLISRFEEVFDFSGTPYNPLAVCPTVYKMQRYFPFSLETPSEIRSGKYPDRIIVDFDENYVEIETDYCENPEFFLKGQVYTIRGSKYIKPLCVRYYNGLGICSDGVPSHNLVVKRTDTEFEKL